MGNMTEEAECNAATLVQIDGAGCESSIPQIADYFLCDSGATCATTRASSKQFIYSQGHTRFDRSMVTFQLLNREQWMWKSTAKTVKKLFS